MELEQLSTDVTVAVGRHLSPFDLIELAYCSTQWRLLITSWRIHVKTLYLNLRGLCANSQPGTASIVIGLQLMRRGFVHFFFYERSRDEIDRIECEPARIVLRKFKSTELKCKVDGSSYKVFTTDPLDAFYEVLDHLLTLFSGPITHLSLGYVQEFLDDVVMHVLNQNRVAQCPTLAVSAGCVISHRLLKKILDMEHLQTLHQNGILANEFKYNKPINVRIFSFPYAEWVTVETLLSLSAELVDLGDPTVSLKDLNAVIHHWMAGTDRKLRRIAMTFPRGWAWDRDWNGERDLYEGLEMKAWDEKKSTHVRIHEYPGTIRKIDCTHGQDIQRADGTEATVIANSLEFQFLVWNYPSSDN